MNTKQQFLFCNSSTPDKVIVYASKSAFELLSENHYWNADGIFRTSAVLFTQKYYVRICLE